MNSRQKGARGERQWRDELRAQGYAARRGQQFSGSSDSPDVVCPALPWIHFEVKAVERLNIEEAMEQARRDSNRSRVQGRGSRAAEESNGSSTSPNPLLEERGQQKVPIVAHRRSFRPWLVTMEAETFFRFLRGDLGFPSPPQDGCPKPGDRFAERGLTGGSGEGNGNDGKHGSDGAEFEI